MENRYQIMFTYSIEIKALSRKEEIAHHEYFVTILFSEIMHCRKVEAEITQILRTHINSR